MQPTWFRDVSMETPVLPYKRPVTVEQCPVFPPGNIRGPEPSHRSFGEDNSPAGKRQTDEGTWRARFAADIWLRVLEHGRALVQTVVLHTCKNWCSVHFSFKPYMYPEWKHNPFCNKFCVNYSSFYFHHWFSLCQTPCLLLKSFPNGSPTNTSNSL